MGNTDKKGEGKMVRCVLPIFPSPGLGLKRNMCRVSEANARQKGSPLFLWSAAMGNRPLAQHGEANSELP